MFFFVFKNMYIDLECYTKIKKQKERDFYVKQ